MFLTCSKTAGQVIYILFKSNVYLSGRFCTCIINRNKDLNEYNRLPNDRRRTEFDTKLKGNIFNENNVLQPNEIRNFMQNRNSRFENVIERIPNELDEDDDFVVVDKLNVDSQRSGKASDEILAHRNNVNTNIREPDSEIDYNDNLSDFMENEERNTISVLEPGLKDVSHIAPILRPTFNFALYADQSEILQKFVKLGVDFCKLERMVEIPTFLIQLDYEKDVQPYIRFLLDKGIQMDALGRFFTRNPNIFKENLDDLQVRINYLESKRFLPEIITKIINVNPRLLSYKVADIDSKLGYFQKEFGLSGEEVRHMASVNPKIITRAKPHLIKTTFTIREEMGFSEDETKELLLTVPKIWHMRSPVILGRFLIVHNEMNVPHSQIVQDPAGLLTREFRTRDRHRFLKELGKAQYDPTKERYIAVKTLVCGTDAEFCKDVANVPIDMYNDFLKTL